MRGRVLVVIGLWGAVLAGCGGSSLKAVGEECVASSECADGLVCDLGQSPAVCAGNVTVVVDAAEPPIDAAEADGPPGTDGPVVDAAVIDAAVTDARIDAPPPPVDASPDAEEPDADVDAAPDA
ncbi:MAG TPA: hypothetical protein VM734_27910 [Kofleriaceae bacterium]|jgi:hypothetical protein|nr:hypothetical protein [Kofleriaceae bacterium]